MRAGSRKLAFAFVAIGLISDRVVMTIVVRLVKYDPQGDIRAQAHAVHVPSSVGISGTLKTRFRQTLQVVGLECRRKYRCRHVFFLPRARHKDAHTDKYCRLLGNPRWGSTPNFLSHGFLGTDIQKFDDLLKRVKEPNFIVKIVGFLRKLNTLRPTYAARPCRDPRSPACAR